MFGKQQDNGLVTERSQYPILFCLSLSVAEHRKTTNSQPVTIFPPMFLLRLLRLVFTTWPGTPLPPPSPPETECPLRAFQRCSGTPTSRRRNSDSKGGQVPQDLQVSGNKEFLRPTNAKNGHLPGGVLRLILLKIFFFLTLFNRINYFSLLEQLLNILE